MKKKIWIWLLVFAMVITTVTILTKERLVKDKVEKSGGVTGVEETETEKTETDETNKTEETEDVDLEETRYSYGDFKGTYAIFEGQAYETPIYFLFHLDENYYFEGYPESESYLYNILDKKIEGNVLSIDWHLPPHDPEDEDKGSNGSIALELDDKNGQKSLVAVETDVRLYFVSEDQLLEDKRLQRLPSQIIKEREESDDNDLKLGKAW